MEANLERQAAKALAFLAYGKASPGLSDPVKLRRAILVAVAHAWHVHRTRANAALAEVQRCIAEAAAVEAEARAQLPRVAGQGEPLPLEAMQLIKDGKARMDAALVEATSRVVGIDTALNWLADFRRFDANAARALLGIERWRSKHIDDRIVETIRRELVEELQSLINKLLEA